MSWGERIIRIIEDRRERKRKQSAGSLGDFYRAGGNDLLYAELPVSDADLVIDAGGYRGEWTAGMLTRYGCHSLIFEPVPKFAAHCSELFASNHRVQVEEAALGGESRRTSFSLSDNGTSEFLSTPQDAFTAEVHDVIAVLAGLETPTVACLKLNIEGGEYEVLERLLDTGEIKSCRSLLIQFHRQPDDWQQRYDRIVEKLNDTHEREWGYAMVWEKWCLRDLAERS